MTVGFGDTVADSTESRGSFDHSETAGQRQQSFDKALSILGEDGDDVRFVDRYRIGRSDGQTRFADTLDEVSAHFADASKAGLKAGFTNGITQVKPGTGWFGTNLFASREVLIYRSGVLPFSGTLAGMSRGFNFNGLESALNTIGHELAHSRHGIDYNGSSSHPNAARFGLQQCQGAGYCQ